MSRARKIVSQFKKSMQKRSDAVDPNEAQTKQLRIATIKEALKALGSATTLANSIEAGIHEGSDSAVGKNLEEIQKKLQKGLREVKRLAATFNKDKE